MKSASGPGSLKSCCLQRIQKGGIEKSSAEVENEKQGLQLACSDRLAAAGLTPSLKAESVQKSLEAVQSAANNEKLLVGNSRLLDIATLEQEKTPCKPKETFIFEANVTKPLRTEQLLSHFNSCEAIVPTAASSLCTVTGPPGVAGWKALTEGLTLKRDELRIENDVLLFKNMELKNEIEEAEKDLDEKKALHPRLEAFMDHTLNLANRVQAVKRVLDQP